MSIRSFALAALAAAAIPAQAAISLTSTATPYTQSFDTLAASATNPVPWTNDSTVAGWFLFTGAGATVPTYLVDTGTSNTGSFRSYGAAGSTDRALGSAASGGAYYGSPASGAVAGYIAVAFTNNTGATLDSFTLAFDGEQWRNGGNTSAQSLALSYGFGATFGTATFTNAPAMNFVSPVTGSTAAAVVGNTVGRVAGLGGTVTTNWAPGETLWVRWADLNDNSNDHGLAIDNVSFTVTAVPEPGTLAMLLAGLATVGFVARRRA